MSMFTEAQINAAIEAEVADWERFFSSGEPATEEDREARRRFHRANVNQNHLGALKQYLGVFPVMTYRLHEALDALKKLAAKAERYGTAKITWRAGDEYQEERRNSDGRRFKVAMTDLIIDGIAAPKVGDFTFIAKAEITDGGTIVDCVPGETLPAGSRTRLSTGECDHCHNKRYRKFVYLVRGADGSHVQVGHTCLRDFLGTDTPASVAARFRWERELRDFDEEWGGRGVASEDNAQELLAVTCAAIRLWGWVPRSAPESAGRPTVENVAVWYSTEQHSSVREMRRKIAEALTEADYKTAAAVMAWVASDESGDSEYIQNLRVILAPGIVGPRRRGYACSAVASYQRWIGTLETRRREAEAGSDSSYVGSIGERLKGLTLRCSAARGMGSNGYGNTVLYKFTDAAGNVFSWFCSSDQELEPGKDYTLDATVKDHVEYKGVKETRLTRGKIHA